MKKAEFDNIYQNEDKHFYYRSIRKTISLLLQHFMPTIRAGVQSNNVLQLLDAGCGTGMMVRELKKFGDARGIDINLHAVKLAKQRGIKADVASVTNLPFKKDTFDVITSIDVIYHASVENDQKALLEFYRVLQPGGVVIVRVSGIKWLKLAHDKYVKGARRYNLDDIKVLAQNAGFSIKKLTYMNFSLAPLAIAKHFYEKFIPPQNPNSHIGHVNPFINTLLTVLLFIEAYLLKYINFPFGLGILLVATKK